MSNSNRGRITYTVCKIIIAYRGWKLPFSPTLLWFYTLAEERQQYPCSLYFAEKFF